jgi:ribosomal protein L11 methyltransferase
MSYRLTLPVNSKEFIALNELESFNISIAATEELGTIYASTREEIVEIFKVINGDKELLTKIEKISDESWMDSWQEHLQPISFQSIKIYPFHHKPNKTTPNSLILEPGRTFGIGHHPTSALMIELLEQHSSEMKERNILDFGCGSGILSLVALKLGAKYAYGVDCDEEAVRISQKNAVQNGFDNSQYSFSTEIPKEFKFDILIINTLQNTIEENLDQLLLLLAPKNIILVSGIIDEVFLKERFKLPILELHKKEEWIAVKTTYVQTNNG